MRSLGLRSIALAAVLVASTLAGSAAAVSAPDAAVPTYVNDTVSVAPSADSNSIIAMPSFDLKIAMHVDTSDVIPASTFAFASVEPVPRTLFVHDVTKLRNLDDVHVDSHRTTHRDSGRFARSDRSTSV